MDLNRRANDPSCDGVVVFINRLPSHASLRRSSFFLVLMVSLVVNFFPIIF
jgi:hypothetical protein